MSPIASWMRGHPGWRAGAAGVVLTGCLALLVLTGGVGRRSVGPAAPLAIPSANMAPEPSTAPSAPPTATPAALPDAASLTQATATARAFLTAYTASPADDTLAALRARLRPYDTDALDVALGQGAASAGGLPPSVAAVGRVTALGLAPDGRLVVTGEIEVGTPDGGARRHVVELYLASTVAGWRVAEVAL